MPAFYGKRTPLLLVIVLTGLACAGMNAAGKGARSAAGAWSPTTSVSSSASSETVASALPLAPTSRITQVDPNKPAPVSSSVDGLSSQQLVALIEQRFQEDSLDAAGAPAVEAQIRKAVLDPRTTRPTLMALACRTHMCRVELLFKDRHAVGPGSGALFSHSTSPLVDLGGAVHAPIQRELGDGRFLYVAFLARGGRYDLATLPPIPSDP